MDLDPEAYGHIHCDSAPADSSSLARREYTTLWGRCLAFARLQLLHFTLVLKVNLWYGVVRKHQREAGKRRCENVRTFHHQDSPACTSPRQPNFAPSAKQEVEMTAHVSSPLAPQRLRCEYLENPLGIDETRPRLSWWVHDPRRGAMQSAYRILVASSAEVLAQDRGDLWDSQKVPSDRNVHVVYEGAPLRSRQRCYWKVRTWDADDNPSPWSEVAWWEMGLLSSGDWLAEWIGLRDETIPPPATYLRKSFSVPKPVQRARVYVTALGMYELRLNGARVGDHILAPGWTDYRRRVLYQTFDVTDHIAVGENALGAILGVGWYAGPLGWGLERNNFGDPPARLLLQLEMELEDGTVLRVVSDGSWKATNDGPIRYSEIYAGELYDARREMPGWDRAGFAEEGWRPVDVFTDPGIERSAHAFPPIRITQELKPVSISEPSPGVYVFDLGQNMAGFCRLRVSAPAGTTIRLRHAEELRSDGSIYTENLRNAKATDTYITRGTGEVETFVPHFTYHGFRYVEVTGYPGRPDLDAITGLAVHTDAAPSATFETSSELVNRLYQNIVWGQRSNMHSVLTDCPQRDERLGWMGDAQIFARTACTNMDMAAFLTKFVRDMADAQRPDGAYTDVVPYVSASGVLPPAGAPAWMDAGVIVPWTVYQCYGDTRLLERHFDSMARYVDYLNANNPSGLWVSCRGNDYGDWVSAGSQTDKTMLATLYFYHSASLVAQAARILGRKEDARKYEAIARRVRRAFNAHYLKNGRYEKATQTINALALGLGIVPKEARASVIQDLVDDIRRRDWHLSTGFVGTKWLLPVLSDYGYDDVAQRLLLNRDYPSWGYMIAKGATTIWELWDSDKKGPEMNSRNHFAFGSVGEWLFRYLAGIETAPDGAGYRHVIIHPHPGQPESELNHVKASYDSVYGRIVSEWKVEPQRFELHVQIPANTHATVYLPAASARQVTEGGRPLKEAQGIIRVRKAGGHIICEVGAGTYTFVVERS